MKRGRRPPNEIVQDHTLKEPSLPSRLLGSRRNQNPAVQSVMAHEVGADAL